MKEIRKKVLKRKKKRNIQSLVVSEADP